MSLPPINPPKSAAGISVDPKTLDRVVAPTKRADGSVRKELKIRPGFTPQEDVAAFRTSRQAEIDARKAGKRTIPGWAPPEEPVKPKPKPKSTGLPRPLPAAGGAKAKDKQKKKKEEEKPVVVKDSWEDDDGEDGGAATTKAGEAGKAANEAGVQTGGGSAEQPADAGSDVDALAKELDGMKI